MNVGNTIKHKQTDEEFEVMNISSVCVTIKDADGILHYITPKGAASHFEIINNPSHVQA